MAMCFCFVFIPANIFAAATLTIKAVNGVLHKNYDSYEPISKGCLVQLILDRKGDGLDPIDFSGSIYPAGDDILLPVLSGSSTFRIGDGLPPSANEGLFSATVTIDNEDPDPNFSGYRIYIRFWDSPNPGKGSFYGETGPFILEEGLGPQVLNVVQDYDLYTNKVLE